VHAEIPLVDLDALHAEIAAELNEAWHRVTATNHFVGGALVEKFEAEWAAYCGVSDCVGVSDGTAALKLALQALGIGPGDEVIVPANTFIATWEAVTAVGARPVAVDVDPATLLITGEAVMAAVTSRTAAVIAVHLYGQPVDMDAINNVGRRVGIAVIEDAAQAHGATWRGRRAGGLGDIGCFSFYPSKNLGALGDAGAVTTNRTDIAERIRSLSNHGRIPTLPDRHILQGHNHRLDALQAALLSVKLPHLDRWNRARTRIADRYREHFLDSAVDTIAISPAAVSSHHLAVVLVDDRDEVRHGLNSQGIRTGVHYAVPCHLQPAFAALQQAPMPVAELAADCILSLPIFPHMTTTQVDRVAAAIKALAQTRVPIGAAAASVATAISSSMVAASPLLEQPK